MFTSSGGVVIDIYLDALDIEEMVSDGILDAQVSRIAWPKKGEKES